MPRLHLVTTCTNKKRGEVAPARRIGELRALPIDERAAAWWARLHEGDANPVPVRDLYVGPHWKRSVHAAELAEQSGRFSAVSLHVLSAGYGLLSQADLVHPYSATLAMGQADSVLSDSESARAWWDLLAARAMPSGGPRTLLDLAESDREATVVVVGSPPYLKAIGADLRQAAAVLPDDRVSIICGGHVPSSLRRLSLTLDGKKAVALGARMVDLAAAAAEHLAANCEHHGFRRAAADQALSVLPSAPAPSAKVGARSASDAEIRAIITLALERGDERVPTKTSVLRELRAEGAVKCESKRFGRLFAEVSGRRT